jgi:putative two-component system response regulator
LIKIDSNNIFDINVSKPQRLLRVIINKLLENEMFRFQLTEQLIDDICLSFPLRDIGTIGISEKIFLKKGNYSVSEFDRVKQHTLLGYKSIEYAIKKLNVPSKDLGYIATAVDVIHYHHECWDGSGYPEGLEKEEIPLSARLVSLVDVFSAILTEKTYRKSLSINEAKDLILAEKNKKFDPYIVDAFEQSFDELLKIINEDE